MDSAHLRARLDDLEPEHRAALAALVEAEGSVRRAAAAMGTTRWTARKRILAALKAISTMLGERDIDPAAVLRALVDECWPNG